MSVNSILLYINCISVILIVDNSVVYLFFSIGIYDCQIDLHIIKLECFVLIGLFCHAVYQIYCLI